MLCTLNGVYALFYSKYRYPKINSRRLATANQRLRYDITFIFNNKVMLTHDIQRLSKQFTLSQNKYFTKTFQALSPAIASAGSSALKTALPATITSRPRLFISGALSRVTPPSSSTRTLVPFVISLS